MPVLLLPSEPIPRPLDHLPADDPAVLRGALGFFTTLRVERGAVHLWSAHRDRLRSSLRAFGHPEPEEAAMLAALRGEFARIGAPPLARIRLVVGLDPEETAPGAVRRGPAWRMIASGGEMRPESAPGWTATIDRAFRLAPDLPLAGHKHSGQFHYHEAGRRAHAAGFDEALLLDRSGRLVEGARTSLFWIEHDARGPVLRTPATHFGGLPGVFAARVRRVAAEIGLEVRDSEVPPERLLGDDVRAVFLTNALREVVPVRRLDEATLPDAREDATTRALEHALERDREDRAEVAL